MYKAHTYTHAYIYIHTCIYIYVYLYVFICTHSFTDHIYMYVWWTRTTHINEFWWMYIVVHTYMYTYSYVLVHVYACVISYFRMQITFWFEAVAQMENSSLQCNYCKVLIQEAIRKHIFSCTEEIFVVYKWIQPSAVFSSRRSRLKTVPDPIHDSTLCCITTSQQSRSRQLFNLLIPGSKPMQWRTCLTTLQGRFQEYAH